MNVVGVRGKGKMVIWTHREIGRKKRDALKRAGCQRRLTTQPKSIEDNKISFFFLL